MEKNRKKLDDLFKDELGSYTETPPPAVWDALEKRLDHTSSKPRATYAWLGFVAITCVLVAISVLVARNITGSPDGVKSIAETGNAPREQHGMKTGKTGNTNTPAIVNENSTQNDPNNQSGNNDPHEDVTRIADKNTEHKADITVHDKKMTKVIDDSKKNTDRKNETVKVAAKPGNDRKENAKTASEIQPQNVYNSSTPVNELTIEDTAGKEVANEETTPQKQDAVINKTQPNALPPGKKKIKQKFDRFEAGIKGGYELGLDNDAARKAVISPFLQYKLSPKFAIMLQPSIKAASVRSRVIDGARSYYNVNQDGNITTQTDSIPVYVIGTQDSFWIWRYTYTQTHDSIVKTNATGGTYIEVELPVLLKYYITKEFSVYGGVNVIYSRQTGLTEQTYISRSVPKRATEISFGPTNTPAPAPPQSLTSEITYTGTPYSYYTGPQYPAPSGSMLRYGYMLGFSYEYNKRWLFDALVQQATAVKPVVQGGYNINTPLSAPYIRLTVGYKLIK